MQPTRVRYAVMAMLLLLSIITYLDRVCINAAAPAMREDLGLSTSQLIGVGMLGLVAFAWAKLAKKAKAAPKTAGADEATP